MKHRVLVVEDHDDIRQVVAESLRDDGYEVFEASDGIDALGALAGRGSRPCVIVLDLMMPNFDGWQFLDAVACDDELRSIPIVVTTSSDDTPRRAARVLRKPYRVVALREAVRDHCPLP